jgi:hypothetical protein
MTTRHDVVEFFLARIAVASLQWENGVTLNATRVCFQLLKRSSIPCGKWLIFLDPIISKEAAVSEMVNKETEDGGIITGLLATSRMEQLTK